MRAEGSYGDGGDGEQVMMVIMMLMVMMSSSLILAKESLRLVQGRNGGV